jgi:hypothetical protein
VIRTLVGSIGLVLSVPITTALAVAISQPAGISRPSGGERRHLPEAEPSAPPPASWDDFGPVGNDVR